MSDAAARVGDAVSHLTAETGKMLQDKIDQSKPVLRDLKDSAVPLWIRPPTWPTKRRTPGFRR